MKKYVLLSVMLFFQKAQSEYTCMQNDPNVPSYCFESGALSTSKKSLEDILLDHSFHFMVSRALYVAADLSIADILHVQPLAIDELASKTGSDALSLQRMMFVLELQDIFKKDDEGYYHTTELSDIMRSDHPQSMKALLLHEDEARWNSYGHLGYSIKIGQPAFEHLYGMPYFDYIKNHPLLQERFNDAMTSISDAEEKAIANTYPFSNYSLVADIGGGRGGMLARVLQSHPQVHGILFDLPQALIDHEPLFSVLDRCTLQGGNFFEPFDLKADAYILKRVLHDWDDVAALRILQNIVATMSGGSRLLIVEALLGSDRKKDIVLSQVDLLLLAVFGGKERTLADFQRLTKAAGLTINALHTTDSLMTIIECVKA